MRIDIVSLFPEFFDAFFSHSIIKRAIEAERLSMGVTNLEILVTINMVKLMIHRMVVGLVCS